MEIQRLISQFVNDKGDDSVSIDYYILDSGIVVGSVSVNLNTEIVPNVITPFVHSFFIKRENRSIQLTRRINKQIENDLTSIGIGYMITEVPDSKRVENLYIRAGFNHMAIYNKRDSVSVEYLVKFHAAIPTPNISDLFWIVNALSQPI